MFDVYIINIKWFILNNNTVYVGTCSEELVGRAVAVLLFCLEAEDLLLQIDYGPTVRHIFQCFIVLTEATTTSCTNVVYTHNSNTPYNHSLLNETMLEQLEPT